MTSDSRWRAGTWRVPRPRLRAAGFSPRRRTAADGRAVLELREPRALDAPDEIAVLLVAAGTPPTRLAVARESLEDHFIRLTAGDGRGTS